MEDRTERNDYHTRRWKKEIGEKAPPEQARRSGLTAEERAALMGSLPTVAPAPHDISIAVLISTVLPGGGQFYNHQPVKGVLLLLAVVLLPLLFGLHAGLIAAVCVWLAACVDAGVVAGRLHRGERAGRRRS